MVLWVLSKGLILKEASFFLGLLSERPEESWDKPQDCKQQAHDVAPFASAVPQNHEEVSASGKNGLAYTAQGEALKKPSTYS